MALRVATGTYTGNGTDNRDITGVGFKPKLVIIKADDGTVGASGVAAIKTGATSVHSFWCGDNTTSLTDHIQAVSDDGFQIGTHSSVNNNTDTYYWVAFGGDDTDIVTGTYTGNGSDDRSITGVGFQPDFVLLKGTTNDFGVSKFKGQTTDSFQYFMYSDTSTNHIQAFETDGFQVGTDAGVNSNTETYDYVAIKESTNAFKVGSYTGNATDDRSITGVGFQPTFVHVMSSVASTRNGVWRTDAHVGDDSSRAEQVVNAANIIQDLESDGFQIGTDSDVNTNSRTYYYIAAKSGGSTNSDIKNHDTLGQNLVAYYDMEEASGTRYDLHNSNNLTDNGTVTQATGKVGKCASFDYTADERLSLSSLTDLVDEWSFSFWAYANGNVGGGSIFSRRPPTGATNNINVEWNETGDYIRMVVYDSGGSTYKDYRADTYSFPTSTWWHVVITWDGTNLKFYKNGSEDTSMTKTTDGSVTTSSTTHPIYIGGQTLTSNDWDGEIDEFGIWKKALSSSEVSDLYNSGSGLPYWDPADIKNDTTLSTDLEAFWSLEETTGTRVDSVATYNLADTNNTGSTTGVSGTAAYFTNTDDERLKNTGFGGQIANAWSIGGWVYGDAASFTATLGCPYNFQGGTLANLIEFEASGVSTGGMRVVVYSSNGSAYKDWHSSLTFTPQTWQHFILTWDGTTLKMYVNGVLDGSPTKSNDNSLTMTATTRTMWLGGQNDTGNDWDGGVDEWGAWSRTLTGTEVRALYGYGTPPPYEAATVFYMKTMNTVAQANIQTINTVS